MSKNPDTRRVLVGISGASGSLYGVRLLERLAEAGLETHAILSRAAETTLAHETDLTADDVRRRASVSHAPEDLAAAPSSGSFPVLGMIVAPCSVRSMAEIATGATTTLLTRAADVTLKERRPLVLMVRETPLHAGHLRTMLTLAEMGVTIAPPMPAFYGRPATIDALVDHSVGRVLDLFGLPAPGVQRWNGAEGDA